MTNDGKVRDSDAWQRISFQPSMRGYVTRKLAASNGKAEILPMRDTRVRFEHDGVELEQGTARVVATHAELWGVLVLIGDA